MTRASLPSRSPKTASPARIVERFAATEVTATLRRELLDDAGAFASLLEAQAALDDWVREYNAERPHQAHETRAPVTPTQRFEPVAQAQRELLPLWLAGALAQASEPPPGRRGARRCVRRGPHRVDQRRRLVGRPPGAGRGDPARPARRDRIELATLMFVSRTAVSCCARARSRSRRTRSAGCAARARPRPPPDPGPNRSRSSARVSSTA
jgi:hypothetical protein